MTVDQEPEKGADASPSAAESQPSLVDAPTPDAETQFLAETTAHERQTRIGWELGIAALLVVLAVAGIAYAVLRGQGPGRPAGTSAPEAPVAAQPTTPGSTPSSAASQTVVASGAPAAADPSKRSRPLRTTPGKVAAAGMPLSELSAPPAQTLAMLVVPKGFRTATFDVVVQPYGWGPGGPEAGRILVKVISSKPLNASARALEMDLVGRNVSAWCAAPDARILSTGGTYSAVLTVRPQGDVGSLYLSDVKPAR